jgi:hypothetical protein
MIALLLLLLLVIGCTVAGGMAGTTTLTGHPVGCRRVGQGRQLAVTTRPLASAGARDDGLPQLAQPSADAASDLGELARPRDEQRGDGEDEHLGGARSSASRWPRSSQPVGLGSDVSLDVEHRGPRLATCLPFEAQPLDLGEAAV